METRKAQRVSFLELPERKPCAIFRFMKLKGEIGALVKQMRADHDNMTLEALAEMLSISKGALSKKENGDSSFREDELEKLAAIFGHRNGWKLYAIASGMPLEQIEWLDTYPKLDAGFRTQILEMFRPKREDAV